MEFSQRHAEGKGNWKRVFFFLSCRTSKARPPILSILIFFFYAHGSAPWATSQTIKNKLWLVKRKWRGLERRKKRHFHDRWGRKCFFKFSRKPGNRFNSISVSVSLHQTYHFFSFYFFLFFSYNSTISLLETSREIDEFFWKIFHETSSPENIYTVESAMGVV